LPQRRTDRRVPRICVYCGSSTGGHDDYAAAARDLARALVERDFELVYGGAAKGTMGVIADEVLALGGKVYGVIPTLLLGKEIAHPELTELYVVDSMHARKSKMESLADGFVALPGGIGTLEELVEILTWAQLRVHDKPCGVINVRGYFDHLLTFLDHAEAEGFLRPDSRQLLLCAADASALLDLFAMHGSS
jgi:uncharacterized protein (TIGR00730 family)